MSIGEFKTRTEVSQAEEARTLNTIKQIRDALEEGLLLSEKEAIKLFDGHDGDKLFLIEHVNQFKGLDQNTIVLKMLHEGRGQWIWNNLEKFDNLDPETVELIYEKFGTQEKVA